MTGSVLSFMVERVSKDKKTKTVSEKIKEKLEFIKKIKHKEYILAAALGLIIVIVFITSFNKTGIVQGADSKNQSGYSYAYTTTADYIAGMEEKLSGILSEIKGAGQVKVMLTVQSGTEIITAEINDEHVNTTESDTQNGSSTTTSSTNSSSPVIITSNGSSAPLIIKENMPTVKGVVVVAEGADNVMVKLEIIKAVQSLLEIDADRIEVFQKN